ncbi:hypothetical protein L7F22_056025 [Adiantum nelumboides]|nr:hypothetical protein [Adiantum nelumboides]
MSSASLASQCELCELSFQPRRCMHVVGISSIVETLGRCDFAGDFQEIFFRCTYLGVFEHRHRLRFQHRHTERLRYRLRLRFSASTHRTASISTPATMSTSKDRDIYDIKQFDGTNFQLWKNQMQDVLVQKKQKLLIIYEEINLTEFQWEEFDELYKSTIKLHFAESVYFSVLECESAYALWQKLCNTYEKDTASNKVFMMQKLFNLRMKKSVSVASHINDFDSLFSQIRAQRINIDDEMKAIFLLCSLPPSWIIFCTIVSNSVPNGTLIYIDATSSLLSEKMRRKAVGSSYHGEAHHVQKDGKQRKSRSWHT